MSQDIKPGYQDRRAFSKAIIMLLLDLKHSLAPQWPETLILIDFQKMLSKKI